MVLEEDVIVQHQRSLQKNDTSNDLSTDRQPKLDLLPVGKQGRFREALMAAVGFEPTPRRTSA